MANAVIVLSVMQVADAPMANAATAPVAATLPAETKDARLDVDPVVTAMTATAPQTAWAIARTPIFQLKTHSPVDYKPGPARMAVPTARWTTNAVKAAWGVAGVAAMKTQAMSSVRQQVNAVVGVAMRRDRRPSPKAIRWATLHKGTTGIASAHRAPCLRR
jgi:hypothetical protein